MSSYVSAQAIHDMYADKGFDKMSDAQESNISRVRRKESSHLASKQLDNIMAIRKGNYNGR